MDAILNRLSLILVVWLLVAFVGVLIAGLTQLLLRRQLRQPIASIPGIRHMLLHNLAAERVRATAQIIALSIGIGYVAGVIDGAITGWALVFMNCALVANSVNEFITIWRMEVVVGRFKKTN